MSQEALMMTNSMMRPEDALAAGAVGGAVMTMMIIYYVVVLAVAIVTIIGMWKTFTKAGKPGWAAIIPFYNTYVMVEVAGRPWWWFLLLFLAIIPFVGWIAALVIWCILMNDISKNFGGGVGTTLGLIFLPFVFFPILGFGKAKYKNVTPKA